MIFIQTYKYLIYLIGFIVFLASLLFFLTYYLNYQYPDNEKISVYECGFEPYEDARNTFDVRFYLVGLLFIIFDLETVFLLPWPFMDSVFDEKSVWILIDFFLELLIGYYYAWSIGAFEWH